MAFKIIDSILEIEENAFIPSIRTTKENILARTKMNHRFITTTNYNNPIGSLALRFAYFKPDFKDFCERYSTFNKYAELPNEENANAGFIYSIGVIPRYRNSFSAKRLIEKAIEECKKRGMDYVAGDARIPSYNGSKDYPKIELFKKNLKFHKEIDKYHETGKLPSKKLLEKDPVLGFYLRAFPKTKVLGITDKDFWRRDEPCGGQMAIVYQELRKK